MALLSGLPGILLHKSNSILRKTAGRKDFKYLWKVWFDRRRGSRILERRKLGAIGRELKGDAGNGTNECIFRRNKMIIRKMEQSDIAACADILCSVYNNEMWQCHWTDKVAGKYLTDFFNMEKFVGYVLEDGKEIIGGIFAHEKVWWNNSEIFVEEMFVKPELQRKGYGLMLMGQIEKCVKENGFAGITLATNKYAPAPGSYRKNGFVDCGHVLFMAKEMD